MTSEVRHLLVCAGTLLNMNILERYQLALSYKEKSEQEHCDWLELIRKKIFDQTHYDLVKATYDRHIKQATEVCDMIYGAQKNSLDDLEEEISALTLEQERLIGETAAGRMKPKKANEQGRILTNEKNRIQKILDTAQTIVDAESTEALGGLIEMPFEEYEDKLNIKEDAEPSPALIADPESKKELNLKNVVVLVLAGLAIWWGVDYYQSIGKAAWSTEITDHRQFLRIQCMNTGKSTLRVYVPWPEGNVKVAVTNSKLKRISFGLLLYVREKGKSEFQLLPETPDIWIVQGKKHSKRSSFTVAGGKRLEIKLDTLALRKAGLKLEAINVVVTRHGGRTVMNTREILLR